MKGFARKAFPGRRHPILRITELEAPPFSETDPSLQVISAFIKCPQVKYSEDELNSIAAKIEADEEYCNIQVEFQIGPGVPYQDHSKIINLEALSKPHVINAVAFYFLHIARSYLLQRLEIKSTLQMIIRDLMKLHKSNLAELIGDMILLLISEEISLITDLKDTLVQWFRGFGGNKNGLSFLVYFVQVHMEKYNDKPLGSDISDFLQMTVYSLMDTFEVCRSQDFIDHLLATMTVHISRFDNVAMMFFWRIIKSEFVSIPSAKHIFQILPTSLVTVLIQTDPFLPMLDEAEFGEAYKVTFQSGPAAVGECVSVTTFENGLDLKWSEHEYEYERNFKVDVLPNNVRTATDWVIKIAVEIGQPAVEALKVAFNDLMSNNRSSRFYETCVAFVYIFQSLNKHDSFEQQMVLIAESPLFNPRITRFDKSGKDLWSILNGRSVVLSAAMKMDEHIYPELLSRMQEYPLLMAEVLSFTDQVLSRGLTASPQRKIGILDVTQTAKMMEFIRHIALNYQLLDIENCGKVKEIEIVRTEIFRLIHSIFSAKDSALVYQKTARVINMLVSHVYEEPVRQMVLNWIVSFENLQEIVLHLLPVFTHANHNVKEPGYKGLITDLLKTVNILMQQQNNEGIFVGMEEQFSHMLTVLEPGEGSALLVCQVIRYLGIVANRGEIRPNTMDAICYAVQTVAGDDPPHEIYLEMLGFLSGTPGSDPDPDFIIRPPMFPFLVSLVKSFVNSSRIIKLLSFLCDLCDYTKLNASACNSGYLDVYLLDEIQSRKMKDDQKEFIEKALQLIKKIALFSSSLPVMMKFIKLLCPDEGRHLSRMHATFISTINDVVMEKRNTPLAYIPVRSDTPVIEVKDVKLPSTFRVFVWMTVADAHCKFTVFTLSDTTGERVKLTVDGKFLEITVNGKTHAVTANMTNDVWTPVSVSLARKESGVEVSLSLGKEVIDVPSFAPWESDKGPYRFVIGDNPQKGRIQGEIGPFAVLPYDCNIDSVIAKGVRLTMPDGALLFIRPEIDNGVVAMNSGGSQLIEHQNAVKLVGRSILQNISLAEVIIQMCKLEVLLPLLAELDLRFIDKEQPPSYAPLITSTFITVLSVGGELGQQLFQNSGGPDIFAYLLMKCQSSHITNELFKKLIQVLGVISNPKLAEDWVAHVLLNIELLLHATPEEQNKISRESYKQLFVNHSDLCNKVRPFVFMLHMLQESLPIDGTLERLNVRGNIMFCIAQLAKIKFTEEDSAFFMNTILKLDMDGKFEDAIDLISNLVFYITAERREEIPHFNTLLYVLCRGNESVVIAVLHLLVRLSDVDAIKLEDYRRAVVKMHSVRNPSSGFFERLLSITKDHCELLDVCALVAMHQADGSFAEEMIKEIANDRFAPSVYTICLGWLFIDKDVGKNIMKAIARSTPNGDIRKVVALIMLIGIDKKRDYYPCLCAYLDGWMDILFEDKSGCISERIKLITDMVTLCLTFRPTTFPSYSEALAHLLSESPFSSSHKDVGRYTSKMDRSLVKTFTKPSVTDVKFRFSIEMTKEQKWEDHNLAIRCMQLLSDYSDDASKVTLSVLSHLRNPGAGMLPAMSKFLHHFSSVCDEMTKAIVDLALDISVQSVQSSNHVSDIMCHAKDRIIPVGMEIETMIKETLSAFKGEKMWRHLWSHLSLNMGPWHSFSSSEESHWRRDNTTCYGHAPMKLKLNHRYQDYKYASLCRDTGSYETAQRQLQTIREKTEEEKNRKYSEHLPEALVAAVTQQITEKTEENGEVGKGELLKGPYDGEFINIGERHPCEFTLYKKMIHLRIEKTSKTNEKETKSKLVVIPAEQIKMILRRPILHLPRGLEIITTNNRAYMIAFPAIDTSELLMFMNSKLNWSCKIQTLPYPEFFKSLGITKQWRQGLISNFDYLSEVNFYSGRSFNDPAMYPVFPWVISDYTCKELDLKNRKVYRNLENPMGVMDPERYEDLRRKKEDLEQFTQDSYCYSCGFSSPLTVYLFLVRTEPFVKLHVESQGGKFDHASRLFNSIPKTFKMACCHTNDFRELIPEFFFDSSFLLNSNGYDLGVTHDKPVGNVILPPWAKTPMDFVYKNRKALESQYVSDHLSTWLDFMFGTRQHDEKNDFNGKMYEDAWEKFDTSDHRIRAEIEAIMQNCGQIPPVLFRKPHKVKKVMPAPVPIEKHEHVIRNMEIIHACHVNVVDGSHVHICIVDSTHKFNLLVIDIMNPSQQPNIVSYTAKPAEMTSIAVTDSGKLIYASRVGVIYILDTRRRDNKPKPYCWHTGKVNCIAADRNTAATGGSDTSTNLFYPDEGEVIPYGIPSFTEAVVAVALSETFSLCVSATRDGSMFIRSTRNKSTVRVVDLEGLIPEKIIITPSWGFIVVYSSKIEAGRVHKYLSLYSVNGDVIKPATEISYVVTCWTSFKTTDGFDFIVLGTDKGEVHMFEAYYLGVGEKIETLRYPLIDVAYSPEHKAVVAVAKNDIFVLPFETPYVT